MALSSKKLAHKFVGLPADGSRVVLKDTTGKSFRQVLWGDWLYLAEDDDGISPVAKVVWNHKNPVRRRDLTIERRYLVDQRPLEIIFVDVGQGDGAILITPERDSKERIIVIDAGKEDHMATFLAKRFGHNKAFNFHAAIITHPDLDHYGGFLPIFKSNNPKLSFQNLYHSGLVERSGGKEWEKLGGKTGYALYSIVPDDQTLAAAFNTETISGTYAKMMQIALSDRRFKFSSMLSTKHGAQQDGRCYVPEFAPADNRGYTIEVLGPWVEVDNENRPYLKVLGGYGKTKNGHSVLLRLTYNNFRILFGGDLNLPAEQYLLMRYAGLDQWPTEAIEKEKMIQVARSYFESEVMKVCHHGSSDITDEFLQSVHPAAFVISSGDEEGHVHPRPDLLGRLGKIGRGAAPVLLSTELQRSAREKEDERLIKRLEQAITNLNSAPSDAVRKKLLESITMLGRSNITVDGAIYIKTDGNRLIAAFRIETGSEVKKWFYFEYAVMNGRLITVDKKRGH